MARAKTSTAKPKHLLERAIANIPEDATIDEAVDVLYLALKVGKGRAEIEAGKAVNQEDVEKSLKQWLK